MVIITNLRNHCMILVVLFYRNMSISSLTFTDPHFRHSLQQLKQMVECYFVQMPGGEKYAPREVPPSPYQGGDMKVPTYLSFFMLLFMLLLLSHFGTGVCNIAISLFIFFVYRYRHTHYPPPHSPSLTVIALMMLCRYPILSYVCSP